MQKKTQKDNTYNYIDKPKKEIKNFKKQGLNIHVTAWSMNVQAITDRLFFRGQKGLTDADIVIRN